MSSSAKIIRLSEYQSKKNAGKNKETQSAPAKTIFDHEWSIGLILWALVVFALTQTFLWRIGL